MTQSSGLKIEILYNGEWTPWMSVVTTASAVYVYDMAVKDWGAENVRIVPDTTTKIVDEDEIPEATVREAATRLLADAEARAQAWGTTPAAALSVSWREMADAWPELADAVAEAVGFEPPREG